MQLAMVLDAKAKLMSYPSASKLTLAGLRAMLAKELLYTVNGDTMKLS